VIRKLALLLLLAPIAFGQSDANQLFYKVSLAGRAEHVVHVSLRVPSSAAARHDLVLPVWNALYQVRDFSQYITRFSAHDDAGRPLPVMMIDKTTWRIESATPFVFEYDILADNAGPFGAQLNDEHAFFNLAEILVYSPQQRNHQIKLVFPDVPASWIVQSALDAIGSLEGGMHYTISAKNYDELVDSPVEIGRYPAYEFKEGGAQYRVLVHADPTDYDSQAIVEQARKLAATEVEWMNDRPFDHYLFIYHFRRGPAGGGMEHAYSTAIDTSAQRVKQDPQAVASVTAHEFFHLWNVKRIRPQSLEPVDYTKEQYSRALWWSEGVTSTVGDLMLVRAGFWDEKQYLNALARQIENLESRPARLTQSVEESSLETWYDKYPSYRQPERSIDYYNKGEIAGVLLDLSVRDATANKKSLRDVFHWLNDNYAKKGKFFPDSAGVEEAAEAVCRCALQQFFTDYVSGTEPLAYDSFFRSVGLRLNKTTTTVPDPGFRVGRTFGQPQGFPAVVSQVDANGPALQAGLKVGDAIQKVNGKPITGPFENHFNTMRVGDEVRLTLAGPREINFKLGGKPEDKYSLVDLNNVTAEQRARRAAWIRGD
jgi:predicted metalloprotease with PDZ domain